MITAVDTSVLIDVFADDREHRRGSERSLREAISAGRLVACEPVWAETSGAFPATKEAAAALASLGVSFDPIGEAAALAAGRAWRAYRDAGGSRARVIADFLIGAHALHQADALLTRDRGFHRRYFSRLRVLAPP